MFQKTILDNGLRVLTVEKPESHSIASGIFVKAGSRNEDPDTNGISHFLEHMVFKGTAKYPTFLAVSEAIEGVGGDLNAWTGEDHTYYHNKVPSTQLVRSLDVVAELVQHPLLREEDIKREKGVIVEEINMYLDVPARHVMVVLGATMWPEQPLGRPILGTKETVTSFVRRHFVQYMQEWYEPRNMVLVVAGKTTHQEVTEQADKLFRDLPAKTVRPVPGVVEQQTAPRQTILTKKTDQAHLAIGFHGLPYADPDRWAFEVMSTLLGQGASSRLFQRIREERGLAYTIRTMEDHFEDTGGLYIHAGLNLGKLEEALLAIVKELVLLKTERVQPTELARVKQFIRGSIEMSVDDTDEMAVWFGRGELFEPTVRTPEEVIALVEAVTPEDIQRVAQRILVPQKASVALIAPVKETKQLTTYLEEL